MNEPKKKTKLQSKQTQSNLRIGKACSSNKNVSSVASKLEAETMPFANLLTGELTHLSFDCPKKLRATFKHVVRANGSSVCHILQTFMVTYLTANHYQKACFSDTLKMPIKIENLVIPSYVKERMRRGRTVTRETVTDEEFVERTIEIVQCDFCGKPLVVAEFKHVNTGMVKKACDYHAKDLRARSDWLEVTV